MKMKLERKAWHDHKALNKEGYKSYKLCSREIFFISCGKTGKNKWGELQGRLYTLACFVESC